jgi:hypothetical protein
MRVARYFRLPKTQEVNTMLRVEMQESNDAIIFRLEGRFTREGAEHIRGLIAQCNKNLTNFIFDLTELLFIDNVGEEVLVFVKRLGAEFIAETSYALNVCERLDLPLAREASQKHILGGSNGHGD